jgi:hypothetical protein
MENAWVALLSRSTLNPNMLTVQCDRCCPAFIATNDQDVLRGLGWDLRMHGADRDICPVCCAHRRPLVIERGAADQGGALPNLVLIGAAKCGTTSLHAYLDEHPAIAMASLKELRFFQDPQHLDWQAEYEAQFDATAKVRGESSTMYTRSPALPGVAARMAALVPDARLIYLVRDPVERALASYAEERFHSLDPRTAEEAFADLDDPYNPYVSASRYDEQLGQFLAQYPREQVLVMTLNELDTQAGAAMRRVFRFLDVDPDHPVDTLLRHNERASKYEYPPAAARLRQSGAAELVRRLPAPYRAVVQAGARKLLSRPMARPQLPSDLEERLRAALAPHTRAFRELTGLALADWSI